MFRLALGYVCFLSLVVTCAAQAETTHTDLDGRFTVAVPEGWKAVRPDNAQQLALIMAKVSGSDVLGLCIIVVTETPLTKSSPQSEIDETLRVEMTKEFWEQIYKSQGAKDVVILSNGARDRNGRTIQYVEVEFTPAGAQGPVSRFKGREEVLPNPGRLHDVGCTIQTGKYEAVSADYEKIFNSFTPQSGIVAQAPAKPASVATLYANVNYDGVARVVSAATPDVAALGWSPRAGSATVSGYGEWQVCEGANYTGKCTLIVGARSAAPQSFMSVRSLRPYNSPPGLRGIASIIATDTILMLNETTKQLAPKR